MTTQNDQLLATTAKLREVLGLAGQSSKTILEVERGLGRVVTAAAEAELPNLFVNLAWRG